MEKRPITAPEPGKVHLDRRNTFLPTYEEHLNNNLRDFAPPESQSNIKSFDQIEEPQRGRRQCMRREYLIIAVVVTLVCAVALPLGLVYILRHANVEQEPATLQTRQAESSFRYAPVATTAPPPPLATAIVPLTVYVTVTPTPEASSSSSTIPVVTVTVTRSADSTQQEEEEATQSTTTTLSISATSSSSSPSSPSSLSVSPTSASPSSSAVSTSTTNSTPAPPPQNSKDTTETETITSATTVISTDTPPTVTQVSKTMQTVHSGRFGFCGVKGSSC